MHRWQIDTKKYWLCNACMKQLTEVIMLGTWTWLEERRDRSLYCDRCKCTDHTVERFGRMRSVLRFFVQPPPQSRRRPKAHRRAL